jgi:hypothetical protein
VRLFGNGPLGIKQDTRTARPGGEEGDRSSWLTEPARDWRRTALRGLLSVAGAALIVLLAWPRGHEQLSGHIDIVGYPTFADFDYLPPFLEYRLLTYVFPAAVIVIYALLAWRGPLRAGPRPDRGTMVPLTVPGDVQMGHDDDAALPEPLALWRPIATAAFVVLASAVGSNARFREVSWAAVASGCVYVLVVVSVAALLAALRRRRAGEGARKLGAFVSMVNAVAIPVVAFGGLWFVSHRTAVVLPSGAMQRSTWLPWWLAGIGILATWLWLSRQRRLGRAATITEQRLRVVLIGSALIYVLIAVIPAQLGYLSGFDDSQGLTGAFLLQHGYFPWRDFQFIHGFFPDVVESLLGFHVFGETAWGSNAGIDLILTPAAWVGVYLLGVWGARRGTLVVVGSLLLAASGQLALDPRFIAIPLILILLGKAIASPRLRWTCGLTAALFVEAIVVPEADFQVAAVFAVVVAVDLVHRPMGASLKIIFRRTLSFIATGAVLTIVWVAFLASQHALTGFVNWFIIFGPGHDAEGAIPHGDVGGFSSVMFKLMVMLVVLTVLSAAWRVYRRRVWTPLAWVTLASALTAGVYGEQALGRYDGPHVQYSLDMALPLFVLVVLSVLPAIDRFVAAQAAKLGRVSVLNRQLAQLISVLVAVGVFFGVPGVKANVLHAPGRTIIAISSQTGPKMLGYAVPNAIAPGFLSNLRSVLDTYAPENAPFFDMTNSPGYFYFLLAQRPAASFTNVSQAIPENTQVMLVNDLRKTRPPLVAFNSVTIGLPLWDGVENQVRHFEVSQYVLDGWTPLLETDGVLFLLRNDLMAHRPAAPPLSPAPVTTDLYSSQAECTWGDSANFLESGPAGRSVTVHPRRVTMVTGSTPTRVAEFRVPGHIPLSAYELATFGARREIGTSTLTLSDMASAPSTAEITAGVLPVTGSRLAVRVGSCLQWHGYRGRTLYFEQQGGAPITSLTLSQVKG